MSDLPVAPGSPGSPGSPAGTTDVGAPSGAQLWWLGARPRTLPAAIVPVLVGTAVASAQGDVTWWRAVAALVVALAIQVGTNYANDVADGVRGTDDARRVGPIRLVGSGLASPGAVRRAVVVSFAVAAVAGSALAAVVGPELLVVGAASIAAGWLYTGGPRPYGYAGLGEVFVFVFFGVVATAGSAYVHLDRLTPFALVASVPVGLLATALLIVNNLRDRVGDEAAGKRTLAVRAGDARTRQMYVGCIAFAFGSLLYVAVGSYGALLGLLAIPLAVDPVRRVIRGAVGPELVLVLMATGRLQLVFGVLVAVGIAL